MPIILLLNSGGGAGRRDAAAGEPPNAAEMLARGWGYTTVGYNDIQPDRADAWQHRGHTATPAEWPTFMEFLSRYFA